LFYDSLIERLLHGRLQVVVSSCDFDQPTEDSVFRRGSREQWPRPGSSQ